MVIAVLLKGVLVIAWLLVAHEFMEPKKKIARRTGKHRVAGSRRKMGAIGMLADFVDTSASDLGIGEDALSSLLPKLSGNQTAASISPFFSSISPINFQSLPICTCAVPLYSPFEHTTHSSSIHRACRPH